MADNTRKTPLTKSSSLYPTSDLTDIAKAQREDAASSAFSFSGIDRHRPGTFPSTTHSWSGHSSVGKSVSAEMPLHPSYNMHSTTCFQQQQANRSCQADPVANSMQYSTTSAYGTNIGGYPIAQQPASSLMHQPLPPSSQSIGFLKGPSGHFDSSMLSASAMGYSNQNLNAFPQPPSNTLTQPLDIPQRTYSAAFDSTPSVHINAVPYSRPGVRVTPYPLLNDNTTVTMPTAVGTSPYPSPETNKDPPVSPRFTTSPYPPQSISPTPYQLPSPLMLPNSAATSPNAIPPSGLGTNSYSPPEIGFRSDLTSNVSPRASLPPSAGNSAYPAPIPGPSTNLYSMSDVSSSFPQNTQGNHPGPLPGLQGTEDLSAINPATQTYGYDQNQFTPKREYLSIDMFSPHCGGEVDESTGYTQPPAPNSLHHSNHATQIAESQPVFAPEGDQYETLQMTRSADPESESFLAMVADLRKTYVSTDEATNPGFLFNQVREHHLAARPIKVIVHSSLLPQSFTCNCTTDDKAEHVIRQALQFTTSHSGSEHPVNFILKAFSQTEYLSNELPLASFEYVQTCLKLGVAVKLELLPRNEIPKPFLRTIADDSQAMNILKDTSARLDVGVLSFQEVSRLLNTFYQKADLLLRSDPQVNDVDSLYRDLEKSVKDICGALSNVETVEITEALTRVKEFCANKQGSHGASFWASQVTASFVNPVGESSVSDLIAAIKSLVGMYCKAYRTDFGLVPGIDVSTRAHQVVTEITEEVSLGASSLHRIPSDWRSSYDKFRLICSLCHGNKKLTADVSTSFKPATSNFYRGIVWNEMLRFPRASFSGLPSETRFCFLVCGQRIIPPDVKITNAPETVPLCSGAIQLFNEKGLLIQGRQLVSLDTGSSSDLPSVSCKAMLSNSVILHVNLKDFKQTISYPEHIAKHLELKPYSELPLYTRNKIDSIVEKNAMTCSQLEYELLWQHRQHLTDQPSLYPRILRAAPCWDWRTVCEVCGLLGHWRDVHPFQSLELLLPDFPDIRVRRFATNKLGQSSPDELICFLPQLIQALKFESYHNSPLARLLLEQSCKSPRFAHQFFWLLRGIASQEPASQHRYHLLLSALAAVCGRALCRQLKKQEDLVHLMTSVTEQVKHATDKDTTLSQELTTVSDILNRDGQMFLPHNLGMEVTALEFKNCSYFSSNAVPMKFVFKNINSLADSHYLIYKIGDDLRQDMLTMQMIDIMDSLWLKHGLDLKMIKFTCLTTGPEKGIIDLVRKSETLHKIQARYGVTGSFRDDPILAWLQKHNPDFGEYKKAIENFTLSCAGYCVATYLMGICDRHNDNIMIKESGHMFHIDFGKFLGDAQMFGSFKRDRVPFVFTSDMAYVITDGGKHSEKFQHFVDLCCQAFNILREHADLLRSLFALMSRSGIHMMTDQAVHYVQGTLLLGLTKAEATAKFTRMIEDSLRSIFTKMNFLAHSLVHMDNSSAICDNLLSFVPSNHSKDTDGQIKSVEVFGHEKRYTPEKHYIFIFMVTREQQARHTFVFRHFSEIMEWRDQLSTVFPGQVWPDFSTRYVIYRSNVRTVADSRKLEIENLLKFIWNSGTEIIESDLVHTFFHTLHRDEEEAEKSRSRSAQWAETLRNPVGLGTPSAQVQGEVQLSIQYAKGALQVMVMHVRGLAEEHYLPSAYVKTRLLPDPHNVTKQKTKAVRRTCNPTFNEVFRYKLPLGQVQDRTLLVAVWNEELLSRRCLGAVYIQLGGLDLSRDNTAWHALGPPQLRD